MISKRFLPFLLTVALFQLSSAQETDLPKGTLFKKRSFFISTYPSAIFTGDVSLGMEFSYKRLRQELAVFYKTYEGWPGHRFDQGKRLNYYLRWDFLKRKNHRIGFGVCYQYLQRYYENKVFPILGSVAESPDAVKHLPHYRSDRKETLWGPGIGISTLSRIYKHFFWGLNLDLYKVLSKHQYVAKKYVSGQEASLFYPSGSGYIERRVVTPYTVSYERRHRLFSLLLKLTYQF